MFDKFTEEVRRAVFFARYEASQFGNREITPEHLLLGIMRESARLVAEWCPSLGSLDAIERQIETLFPRGEKIPTTADLPLSNGAKRALAYAVEESLRIGHKHIRAQHLLIGLVREEK